MTNAQLRLSEGIQSMGWFVDEMTLEPYRDLPAPLPCPFEHKQTDLVVMCHPHEYDEAYDDDMYHAECYFCSAQGPWADSAKAAAEKWNDRHST